MLCIFRCYSFFTVEKNGVFKVLIILPYLSDLQVNAHELLLRGSAEDLEDIMKTKQYRAILE